MKNNLSVELEKITSPEEMLEYFEIPYNKKQLKSHRHQFLRHLKKHLAKYRNMHNWNDFFLYNFYKDMLIMEYNKTVKTA